MFLFIYMFSYIGYSQLVVAWGGTDKYIAHETGICTCGRRKGVFYSET